MIIAGRIISSRPVRTISTMPSEPPERPNRAGYFGAIPIFYDGSLIRPTNTVQEYTALAIPTFAE
jgi:hypothetical protein